MMNRNDLGSSFELTPADREALAQMVARWRHAKPPSRWSFVR